MMERIFFYFIVDNSWVRPHSFSSTYSLRLQEIMILQTLWFLG